MKFDAGGEDCRREIYSVLQMTVIRLGWGCANVGICVNRDGWDSSTKELRLLGILRVVAGTHSVGCRRSRLSVTPSRAASWVQICVPAIAAIMFSACSFAATMGATHDEPRHKAIAETPQPEAATSGFHESAADLLFEHLDSNVGLASPVVTVFAEDGDGFLWVGSQSGLQRWDGYRFWTYKTVLGSSDSLPDDLVQALYTDWQGRLWVGTSSGGLAMYDRRTDKFVRYRSSPNDLNRVDVFSITGDGGRGLWVGSSTGLDHLDTDSGKFDHMGLPPIAGREPDQASALLRTADGTLWVGTDQGLERSVKLDAAVPGHSVFEAVPLPPDGDSVAEVLALLGDSKGRVWMGTSHGAFVVDPPNAVLSSALAAKGLAGGTQTLPRPVTGTGPGNELLATQHYLSMAETSLGEIWLGTQDEGVLAVTPTHAGGDAAGDSSVGATWQVRHIHNDSGIPTSLSDDMVYGLYLGRSGIMWAATRRGVNYLDTAARSVFTMQGGSGTSSVIRDRNIYSVLARQDGTVWLAQSKHGIEILDADGRRVNEVETGTADTQSMLPLGVLNDLVEVGDGSVFVTTQRGLYRVTPGSTAKAPPRVSRVAIGPGASTDMTRVLPDDGKLWIGCDDGLWLQEVANGPQPAKRLEMRGQLSDQRITALMRDGGSSLWVGTQNGLNRLNLVTREVETVLADPANPTALGGGYISSLLTDHMGRLWVGTFSGGIDVMEGRDASGKPKFHRIVEGLPNENIDMLLEAKDGKIWASMDGGLAAIDPDTFAMQILTHADGGVLPAYWNGSGAMTTRGELLFGGEGGLTIVKPELVKAWTYQPPVVVTNARIGDVDIPTSRLNSGLSEYPVWIPSDQNNLTVGFTALDYTAPEMNRYEYKLDGFDKGWIAADASRRLARYTNLPPGDYMLELRGSNRQGVWAPARQVRIRVLPAWFQTWWFKILAAVLGLLLLYLFFLLATAYLRRQQRVLERQVALRTRELERMTEELKESQQKLEHMAYTDALTNLPNRRMFAEHFKQLLALKRRQNGSFSVLLMDFDDFKRINDTYGHDAGDYVLIEMARRMGELVRESDCLARLGGDEFGILLGQSHDVEGTENVCRKLVESFEAPILFDGAELRTAPSIGIALYPFDGETQDTLYKTADLALYEAKRKGGNGSSWSSTLSTSAEMK